MAIPRGMTCRRFNERTNVLNWFKTQLRSIPEAGRCWVQTIRSRQLDIICRQEEPSHKLAGRIVMKLILAMPVIGLLLFLTSAAPLPPLAVVEQDSLSHGVSCHGPMRLRNLTPRTIVVTVAKTWKQQGPSCNIVGGTSNLPPIDLDPNASSYLGCSILFHDGSMCSDHTSWRYVSALERIIVEATPPSPQNTKEPPSRRADTGGFR